MTDMVYQCNAWKIVLLTQCLVIYHPLSITVKHAIGIPGIMP